MRRYAEHGAEGLTMRTLAGDIGCSAMTPYRYFRDKDEILAAMKARAFNDFSETLDAAAAGGGDSHARAAQVGEAYVEIALNNREAYRLMFESGPVETQASCQNLAAARAKEPTAQHDRLCPRR